ncbi:translocation/assembly module TamB domain-containing protein [Teredinibacter franksiae]|uniref:translocation/assembly module TamB domain-containing protein n=1 Tax=Teredinibacter franksiae TaxID=2761453 RepID=UPI001624C3C3|nr:translocation/assembly module TamB domain-containing protein [Teredinibacter franksiae]
MKYNIANQVIKVGRKIAKSLLYGLLTLTVVCALCVALLSIDSVREHAVSYALKKYNNAQTDIQINLEGITSTSMGRWYVARGVIALENQEIITVEKFNLALVLSALWDKHIHIQQLSAATVRYSYYPLEEKTPEPPINKESVTAITLPNLWQISLDSLAIKRLRLNLENLAAVPPELAHLDYQITGMLKAFSADTPLAITLEAFDANDNTRLSIKTREGVTQKTKIEGSFREKSEGLFAQLFTQQLGFELNFVAELDKASDYPTVDIQKLRIDIADQLLEASAFLAFEENNGLKISRGQLMQRPETERNEESAAINSIEFSGFMDSDNLQATINTQHFDVTALHSLANTVLDDLPPLPTAKAKIEQLEFSFTSHPQDILNQAQLKLKTRIAAEYNETPLLLMASLDGGLEKLQLDDVRLVSNDSRVKVSGQLDFTGEENNVAYALKNFDLSLLKQLSAQYPPGLTGVLNGKGSIKGLLEKPNMEVEAKSTFHYPLGVKDGVPFQQSFKAELKAKYLTEIILIESASLVNITSNNSAVDISGQLDLTGDKNDIRYAIKDFDLSILKQAGLQYPPGFAGILNGKGSLKGLLQNPNAEVEAESTFHYPVTFTDGVSVEESFKAELKASYLNQALHIEAASLLNIKQPESVVLFLLKGDVDVHKKSPVVSLQIEAEKLPMALLEPYGWSDTEGALSINVNIDNTVDENFAENWEKNLLMEGKLRYETRIKADQPKNETAIVFDVNVAEVAGDSDNRWWQLKADLGLKKGKEHKSNELVLSVKKGGLTQFLKDGESLPVTRLEGHVDMAVANFILPDSQKVTGTLVTDVDVSGDLDRPNIKGVVEIRDVNYRHSELGTSLNNASALLSFEGTKVYLKNLQAKDDGDGRIAMNGLFDWQKDDNAKAIELSLDADKFSLFEHDHVEGKISANVQATGNVERILVKGDIIVSPLSISIAANPGPSIPEIEYEFEQIEEQQRNSRLPFPVIELDINIGVNQQAYIRGRGLEAELEGKMNLKGPTNKLEYQGAFNTIRGGFELVGKQFSLEKGEVGFSNNAVIILVVGVYEDDEMEVRAEVSGTGEDFNFKLTSIPSMPEDELIAKLIFGSSVQDISALQALQLASTVQRLKGGQVWDPVGEARNILHVDTLSIDTETTDEGTELKFGAGKYITDRVYLEIERSAEPAHPWQGNLLIELTPAINLETTTGGASGGWTKLVWKHDY